MGEISLDRLIEDPNAIGGIEISPDRLQAPSGEMSWQQNRPVRQAASNVYRPALEMGGLVGGAIAGTAAGGPVGGVGGAGLTYSIGSNIADRLDEFLGLADKMDLKESSIKAAEDIKSGAEMEMAGGIVGKTVVGTGHGIWKLANKMGLTGLFKKIKGMFPSMSDRGMLLKAKEALEQVREPSKISTQTGKETEAILRRTGIKTQPTFAQKTGSPKAASFEQSMAAKDAELANILKGQDAEINSEMMTAIQKQFPGKEDAGEIVAGVAKHKTGLEKGASKAVGAAEETVAPLALGQRQQDIGRVIKESLESGRRIKKDQIDALYLKIPKGTVLSANPVNKTVVGVTADFKKIGGGPGSYPSAIVKQIKAAVKETEGKSVTFDNLRDWRSQITTEIRDEYSKINPNLKLVRRLSMLEKGVDEAMEQMRTLAPEHAQTVELYKKASDQFKGYIKKYRKGTVGDVLASGRESTGGKVAYSDIPSRFFRTGKMDAADDLVRTVGKEKAGTLIDDYAGKDFLSRATDNGEVNTGRAIKWFKANKDVLDKYGLTDKFQNIIRSKKVADTAVAGLAEYEKTVASKIIGTDVGDVMKSIFSGKGKMQSAKMANDLLKLPGVKDNPAAVAGIKNAFKDYLLKTAETSGVDVLGNPVQSMAALGKILEDHMPAMRVLYAKESGKIKALQDYHNILRVLGRNKNVTYAGGSATVEKAFGARRETTNTIARNIGQLVAIQKGKGFMFGAIKNIWKAITGAPRKFSEEQINRLLTEAIYSPSAAQIIMDASKPYAGKAAQNKFKKYLLTMGAYTIKKGYDGVTE